jgi:hypothetical protein
MAESKDSGGSVVTGGATAATAAQPNISPLAKYKLVFLGQAYFKIITYNI